MIQLNDPALKRALIEKHHFQEHFSLDLEKCSVLLRCEAGETLCHSGEIYPEIQLLADGAPAFLKAENCTASCSIRVLTF